MLAPGERPWPADWTNTIICIVCPHTEWESVLVPAYKSQVIEEVVRCTTCHAPRCGDVREADPCVKVKGHGGYHWMATHRFEKPVEVG